MSNPEERPGALGVLMFIMSMFIITFFAMNYFYGWTCHIKSIGEDRYCSDDAVRVGDHDWKVRSHEEDRINSEKRAEEKRKIDEEQQKKIACYASGYDYNESFDIFDDYNLTCKKIAYLNDHLMDNFEKKDGGYIRGSYSGFLSHGSVEGKSYEYINERIVATGKLIENIKYHVDCENSTNKYILTHDYHRGTYFQPQDTTKIDYFTEEEFVMTYVDRCIN